MAEQKACEGVVAAAQHADASRSPDGETSSASSVHGESLLLPYLVEHLRSSLQQQQQQQHLQQQQQQQLQQLQHQHRHHLYHLPSAGHAIEDSGTESGEDLRFLVAGLRDSIELHRQESSPSQQHGQPHGPGPGPGHDLGQDDLLDVVQSALTRLEASLLQGVVGSEKVEEARRESLLQLVGRLRSSLGPQDGGPPGHQPQPPQPQQDPVPPPRRFGSKKRQNRHTVGVSQEELADARRFLEEAQAKAQAKAQQPAAADAAPPRAQPPQTSGTAGPGDSLPAPLVVSLPLPLTRARSPYHLQKQSSAGDVPAVTAASTFRAYRPIHFMPRKFSHSAASTTPSASASGSSLAHSESVQDAVQSKSSSQSSVSRGRQHVRSKTTPRSSYSSIGSQSNEDDEADEEEEDEDEDIDKDDEEGDAFVEARANAVAPSIKKVLDDNANLVPETDISHKDYDPSKKLFTPQQSVQIAVHKAAINKQISIEEEQRKTKQAAARVSSEEEEEDESDVTESVAETEEEESYYDVEEDDGAGHTVVTGPKEQGLLRNQTFTVNPAESIIGKIEKAPVEPKRVSSKEKEAKQQQQQQQQPQPKQNKDVPPPKTVMVPNPVYIEDKAVPRSPPSPVAQHLPDPADTQSNASDTSDTLQGDDPAVSSAQRLLKMATNDSRTATAGSRFASRNNKKQKMKRANTIDIPKPLNYYEVEEDTEDGDDLTSGDEAFFSAHDGNAGTHASNDKRAAYLALRGPIRVANHPDAAPSPQQLKQQPKTEGERKFLAFLEQQGQASKKGGPLWSGAEELNGSARASPIGGHNAGHQWNNRFANIKTAFENNTNHQTREQQLNKLNSDRSNPGQGRQPGGARSFWQTADDSVVKGGGRGGRGGRTSGAPGAPAKHEPKLSKQASAFLKQLHEQGNGHGNAQAAKLPWTAAEHPDDPGVVVGSLTVPAANRQQQLQQQQQQVPAPPQQGPINKFFHAPMSAFKPIEKSKATPSAPWATPPASTGSVKQLAAKKFEQPAPPTPEKPVVVHAPKALHQPHLQPHPHRDSFSLPVPAEQAPSPLSPTLSLPWKKDLGHSHHLTSTLAKFESMSSRETSPQLLPIMRSQSQDRMPGMRQYAQPPQPPQPPPRAFIPTPSTGNVQSRTQTFSDRAKQSAPALPPHSAYAHEFSTRPGFGHGLVHSKSNQYVPTVPNSDHLWHHYESEEDDDATPPPTDNKLVLSTLQGRELPAGGPAGLGADLGGLADGGYVSPQPIPTFSAGVTVRQSVFGVPACSAPQPPRTQYDQAHHSSPDSYLSTPPPTHALPYKSHPPRMVIQHAASPVPSTGSSAGSADQNTPEPEEHSAAVARVMGGAQCQKAVTVTNKMRHRYDDDGPGPGSGRGGGGGGGGGVSSAALNLTSVLNKLSSEEEISPKPTAHQQQEPRPHQQQRQQPPERQHTQHQQPQAPPSKLGTSYPRYRSEPNASAITEASRAYQSNGSSGSPMTSVRASPAGTPYPNQSQSPDWSAHHPAPRVSSLAGEDRRNQASNKYAEARSAAGRVNASAASATSTPVAARSRTSSVDSLITATSTEELHDSGESVVTTRLQIPVNKVADTIQRYQAHTQAHSQGQDPAERSERSPSVSPNPGNVLRKSESWHQLAAQQQGLSGAGSGAGLGGRTGRPQSMHGGQDLPPAAPARSPALPKAKSSHNLAFPKQFEAAIKPDALQVKQKTVEQYFRKTDGGSGGDARTSVKVKQVHHHHHHHQHQHQQQQYSKKSVQSALTVNTKRHSQTSSSHEPLTPMEVLLVDDNLDNVDEAFESLFAASVGSDGRTLTRQTSAEGKANYKQRRMSHTKSKLGGYSASVSRTSGAQGGGAVKSSK